MPVGASRSPGSTLRIPFEEPGRQNVSARLTRLVPVTMSPTLRERGCALTNGDPLTAAEVDGFAVMMITAGESLCWCSHKPLRAAADNPGAGKNLLKTVALSNRHMIER